jgi:hypothetical protein
MAAPGRVAQWESAAFTRQRPEVRYLSRPPHVATGQGRFPAREGPALIVARRLVGTGAVRPARYSAERTGRHDRSRTPAAPLGVRTAAGTGTDGRRHLLAKQPLTGTGDRVPRPRRAAKEVGTLPTTRAGAGRCSTMPRGDRQGGAGRLAASAPVSPRPRSRSGDAWSGLALRSVVDLPMRSGPCSAADVGDQPRLARTIPPTVSGGRRGRSRRARPPRVRPPAGRSSVRRGPRRRRSTRRRRGRRRCRPRSTSPPVAPRRRCAA